MLSTAAITKLSSESKTSKSPRETWFADNLLNQAFELAYFILGDRSASIYVATVAMDKLKLAYAAQARRLQYIPTGRSEHPAARTKVNLNQIHLLQTLVYSESELYEKLLEEQKQSLHYEDLIIRYIKNLVRHTIKYNSFHVALGICRLLYNYSTCDTAEIYNLVLQDPVRMRDDDYYRARKKRLMREIENRFGPLIRPRRCRNGEQRFTVHKSSQRVATLVKECLDRLTPWQSPCVLPMSLDPQMNVVGALLFDAIDPDQEHGIELNRIHTLIHPPCFERLTRALGLEPPDRRLEIPYFFISAQGPQLSATRFTPPELSETEINASKAYWNGHSLR